MLHGDRVRPALLQQDPEAHRPYFFQAVSYPRKCGVTIEITISPKLSWQQADKNWSFSCSLLTKRIVEASESVRCTHVAKVGCSWLDRHVALRDRHEFFLNHSRDRKRPPSSMPHTCGKRDIQTGLNSWNETYCQTFNIRRTYSQNLNVSHLVLQMSLPDLLKPGVKSRMKM